MALPRLPATTGPVLNANVQTYLLTESARPLFAELLTADQHVERRVEGALGIVLVGDGGAEHGQHGVADELLDEALVALDRRGHLAEETALDRAHVFGIEALAPAR